MALKYKYQIGQVPAGANAAQIEAFLNTAGESGWQVIQILQIGTNYYVIAIKELSE